MPVAVCSDLPYSNRSSVSHQEGFLGGAAACTHAGFPRTLLLSGLHACMHPRNRHRLVREYEGASRRPA